MIVPAIGPTNSPLIALVGEAPGEEEVRRGEPFVGPSGFLLNQMLATAGIARADCYITNVSQVRPPNNDFGAMYYEDKKRLMPTSALCDCRERLWTELKAVNPKIVVALGVEAMKALTPARNIKDYRGTVVEEYGIRCLPTYHPAMVLRSYEHRPIVEADLKKALRQAVRPSKPVNHFNPNPTFSDVMDFLKTRPPLLSLDIETIKCTTRMIGLAWSKQDAICIPFISRGQNHWAEDQEAQICFELDKLFRDPSVGFILQNAPFDFTILARDFGFVIANPVLDTMFAHHLLFPELPKGLDFLCSIYTNHPMYWGYDSSSDASTREYNCMDCVVTFEAAEDITTQLKERNQWDYYQRIIHRAVPALTRVQSRGVLIDVEERAKIGLETQAEMDKLKLNLQTMLKRDFNPSSHPQVKALVYDEWKLPTQKKRTAAGMVVTSDEDALKALCKKTTDPHKIEIMQAIITYRQKRTLLSTFVEMPLKNNRSYTSYNIAGTVTGRLASSSTFDGYGGNLQNIPRGKFRRIFKADPGKILLRADLSQAEYRVLIWKTRLRRLIEKLTSDPGFSIHMWNASVNIYQVPVDQITKKMYDDSKNGIFGSNYGIGDLKISRMYDIDLQRAKLITTRYHTAVPEIKQVYQKEIREEVIATRKLVNPLGRERIFFGRMDDDLYRAAYSHYCQSTVGDLISLALIELDDCDFEILLQVHDELVIQVPIETLVESCQRFRQAMERPIMIQGTPEPLIIPCEIKVGFDWFNTKPLNKWLEEQQDANRTSQVVSNG